jgi:acetyl-CoA C-acetyltransferase
MERSVVAATEQAPTWSEQPGLPDIYIAMGITAENVADKFTITREEMDHYAYESQSRAAAAIERGFFAEEITPYTLTDGTVISADDSPRPGTTIEALAGLPPAFRPTGRVTAGNACPLNDGAAAIIVMSEDEANKRGLKPLARIVGATSTALNPEIMGVGPIDAVKKVLAQTNMTISDIDVVELNEAFAAQVIPCMRELGIERDKLNINGGAIALGHPFGMTGARIMTTLLHAMAERDAKYGLETMCVGGGQGMAMIVERL